MQETLAAARQPLLDEISEMELTAGPEDLDTLSGIRAMLDAAAEMSTNPYLQDKSIAASEQAGKLLYDMKVKNEEQAVAAEVAERKLQYDLDAQQYTRFKDLRTAYDNQSQGFENSRLAANKAREALKRGSPVDLKAAVRLAIRTVEPTGPLTDADVAAYSKIGNITDRMDSMVEEWIGTGASLTDPVRQQFLTMINGFERENAALQMTRDVRFQELADISKLPERQINYFNRVGELPVNLGGRFIPSDEQGKATDLTSQALGDAADNIAAVASNFTDQALINAVGDIFGANDTDEEKKERMNRSLDRIPNR